MSDLYLGIDPGNIQTGWALWDGKRLVDSGVDQNWEIELPGWLVGRGVDQVGIEMVGHYGTGMAVGKTVFHTCVAIGQLVSKFRHSWGIEPRLILRPSVKAAICGSAKAKDGNVVQALKDQIGEKGTKANPGPLYGIKSHAWQALALAVAMQRGSVQEVELGIVAGQEGRAG